MKKNMLFILAFILILSCATIALADVTIQPTLTLRVAISNTTVLNVAYIATLKDWVSPASQIPVITFYCNNVEVGKAPINNTGVAILKLTQTTGKYEALSAWLNTPAPIMSNIVYYSIP